MEALITALLLFIGAHSDLNVAVPHPAIRFVSQEEMLQLYFGDKRPIGANPQGMYDPYEKTGYLLSDWDAASSEDHSRLLHELIHHAQYHPLDYRKRYQCVSQMEAEAIKLTDTWRVKNGFPPWVAEDDLEKRAILTLYANCIGSHIH